MKKINSLLDQYKFSLKTMSVSMPLAAVIAVITGIVYGVINREIWWVCVIIGVVLGLIPIVMYIFIRKYMLKKIDELKQQEQDNQKQNNVN